MLRKNALMLFGLITLLLTGIFLAAAQFSAPANKGFASSASVLSIIAATAIGIERVIEGFWTIVGMTKGAWFPMNVLESQVEGMINNLNSQLECIFRIKMNTDFAST